MLHDALKVIPAEGEPMLLELVCRIEKLRTLHHDESKLIECIIKRERDRAKVRVTKRVWTHTQKTALLTAAKSRGGVKKFAIDHNMPERTAWHMLRNLRNGMTKRPSVKGVKL
jgi:hypothetical protein